MLLSRLPDPHSSVSFGRSVMPLPGDIEDGGGDAARRVPVRMRRKS
jgi:hypothetical protein